MICPILPRVAMGLVLVSLCGHHSGHTARSLCGRWDHELVVDNAQGVEAMCDPHGISVELLERALRVSFFPDPGRPSGLEVVAALSGWFFE